MSLIDLDARQNMRNQNETVLVYYKEGVSVSMSKKRFYDKEILYIALRTMASLDIVSSFKHTRYFTLECCLICLSPYFMLSLLIFFFLNLAKKT